MHRAPVPSRASSFLRWRRWANGIALGASLALTSGAACAWGAKGHAMVAEIATQFLTPQATAEVAVLLRDDLGADGKPSGRNTLSAVSSWPDEWRLTPAGKPTGIYHYDDIPICGRPDKAAYCKDGKCGTVWFGKQLAVLKDRSQSPRARNEALKWVVHLIGDLHQPLHMSDHDDQGGNRIQVTFLGKRADEPVDGRKPSDYNLHTAWDRLIPERAIERQGGHDRFLAALPSATTRADWEVGTLDEWSMETFLLARDFIYPSLPVPFACDQPVGGVVPIDARIEALSESIASEQLRKAGVRLAKVLNDVLVGP